MHLIQILLPLTDNKGNPFSPEKFLNVKKQLTEKFGGLTAFTRVPADGVWVKNLKTIKHDEIVVFEVQTKKLDKTWWKNYRMKMEQIFRQDVVIVRAQKIEIL